ncbi:hypothetical protein CEXT_154381 [Caerostris extrusa]|uniref:Uncharacterized protein n=1 Tax=Caerostris extrusa TaxID=172846 RepID=A0AAV4XK88_CAEEX|nr:hypothetical protein CEXT_154381 [Caerostris extrusa]
MFLVHRLAHLPQRHLHPGCCPPFCQSERRGIPPCASNPTQEVGRVVCQWFSKRSPFPSTNAMALICLFMFRRKMCSTPVLLVLIDLICSKHKKN